MEAGQQAPRRQSAPRLTPQRTAVLETLAGSADHPTAAELIERVREHSPGIGPATVYRALNVLVRAGLAVELAIADGGATRYDANTGRHDHLVCTGCGRIDDVHQPEPDLTGLGTTGFLVSGYDLRVHGLCPECQRDDSAGRDLS